MTTSLAAPLDIRPMLPEDADIAAAIFSDAVIVGAAEFYSAEQRAAWAGPASDLARWRRRLASSLGVVALRNGRAQGFMTFVAPDLIDLAYVRPEVARQGVGGALIAALEPIARACGATRLRTEASKLAHPFFTRHGFETLGEQIVERSGIPLVNYKMQKPLLR